MDNPTFRYLQVDPQNIPPSGKIKSSESNNVITFVLSEIPAMLKSDSLRINGNLEILLNGTDASTDADKLNINMKAGIYGLIDQIIIKSVKSGQVIEHLEHVSKFSNLYKTYTESMHDQLTYKSQTELSSTNYLLNKEINVNGKKVADADNNKLTNTFSFRPISGFLGDSKLINLDSATGLGGLKIEFHLNSSSAFFNSTDGLTSYNNAEYLLSKLKLTCMVNDLTPQDQQQLMKAPNKTMSFSTIKGIYTAINSSNGILNFKLASSRVKAVSLIFLPSNMENNNKVDSNTMTLPLNSDGSVASIRSVQFLRNGVKFPQNYQFDTNYKSNDKAQKLDSHLLKSSFGAFVQNGERLHFESTTLTNRNSTRNYTKNDLMSWRDGGIAYSIGVNYAHVKGGFADFSGNNLFGCQFDLDLTSQQQNNIYVFIHKETTLTYNTNGVSILD